MPIYNQSMSAQNSKRAQAEGGVAKAYAAKRTKKEKEAAFIRPQTSWQGYLPRRRRVINSACIIDVNLGILKA